MKLTLLKITRGLFSVVKMIGYAIALPIAIPTFVIFETITYIDDMLCEKIKENEI